MPGCHLGWRGETLWRSGRVDRLTAREDLGNQPAHGAGGQRPFRSSQWGPATGTGFGHANPSDTGCCDFVDMFLERVDGIAAIVTMYSLTSLNPVRSPAGSR